MRVPPLLAAAALLATACAAAPLAAQTAAADPTPAAAQDDTVVPPPGIGVERTKLMPGETKSFILAPGKTHQLLIPAKPGAPGSVTIGYAVGGGRSVVTASSRAGALSFTILADRNGDGGYTPAGRIAIPAGGAAVTGSWPGDLGTINVGDFAGGPHGDHDHVQTGTGG